VIHLLFTSPALGYTTYSIIHQPCFSTTVQLFGSLGCSIGGPSYISSEAPRSFERSKRSYLTLTDSRPQNNFRPWSYDPVCTEKLEELGDMLCVFTSSVFLNGRGISIITTPGIAEELSALPVFHAPPSAVHSNISSSTHISKVPDKGRAVIASSDIKQGEFVTADAPIVLFREGLAGILSLQERKTVYTTSWWSQCFSYGCHGKSCWIVCDYRWCAACGDVP
jgi:hypothetical protein